MRSFRILMGITMAMSLACLIGWIIKTWYSELPIAPSITMLENCDSGNIVTHVYNHENKPITCSYTVYMDVNDNRALDSMDMTIREVPNVVIGSQAELVDIPVRPVYLHTGLAFIVKLKTDKLITYYRSIPCDKQVEVRNSTPTK